MNKQSFSLPPHARYGSDSGSDAPATGTASQDEVRGGRSSSPRNSPFRGGGAGSRSRMPPPAGFGSHSRGAGAAQRLRPDHRINPWPWRPGFGGAWPIFRNIENVYVPDGADRIRWARDCLNNLMSASLPDTPVLDPATRSLIRTFQRRQGLAASGVLDDATVDALRIACAGSGSPTASGGEDQEMELLPHAVQSQLPSGDVAQYRYCCRLTEVPKTATTTLPRKAGVYLIVFDPPVPKLAAHFKAMGFSGKEVAYSGMADKDLRERLDQHRREVMRMGFLPNNHRVFIRVVDDPQKPRELERGVNSALIPTGLITNRQTELEEREWGFAAQRGPNCPGCGCAQCRCAPLALFGAAR